MKKDILHVCGSWNQGGVTAFVRSILELNESSNTVHDLFLIFEDDSVGDVAAKRFARYCFGQFSGSIIRKWIKTTHVFNEYKGIFLHKLHPILFFPVIFTRAKIFVFQHGLAVSNGRWFKRTVKKKWYSIMLNVLKAKVICSTEFAFQKSLASGIHLSERRKLVIPFGIDLSNIEKNTERDGADSGKLIVGSAGRLARIKRFDMLIESLMDYNGTLPVVLKIAGDGPERNMLETLAVKVNASNANAHVELLGNIENMHDFYHFLDIFVFPSHNESFGLVVLEALAHGIPVAVFEDLGGALELLKSNRNGLIISAGINGLKELWNTLNTDERLIQNLKKFVISEDLSKYGIHSTRGHFDSLVTE